MNGSPRVSVLMPVYNCGSFLREAIESILVQSFFDFELLLVNDGSTDDSAVIAASFHDNRIRLLHNECNCGLVASLNRGLEVARGEFVARMDGDDISLPQRLERQVEFLDANPHVGVCGSWFRKFYPGGTKVVRWECTPAALKGVMLFSSPLAHPTVMFRRELFASLGLFYESAYESAEDYDLWQRASQFMDLANLPEVLLDYRVHAEQVTSRLSDRQSRAAGMVRRRILHGTGIDPSPEEFAIHEALSLCDSTGSEALFHDAARWLCRLKSYNGTGRVFAEPDFSRIILERWFTFGKKIMVSHGISAGFFLETPRLVAATGLGWGGAARLLAAMGGR